MAPNDYYPYFVLGQMYVTLHRHEEAVTVITRAVDLSTETQAAIPDDLTAVYNVLERAYFSRDRIDDAISAWQKISELDPQNIFSHIELANLFREQELYSQAVEQHEAIASLRIHITFV